MSHRHDSVFLPFLLLFFFYLYYIFIIHSWHTRNRVEYIRDEYVYAHTNRRILVTILVQLVLDVDRETSRRKHSYTQTRILQTQVIRTRERIGSV